MDDAVFEQTWQAIKDGLNVILMGPGGCGKSHNIRVLSSLLVDEGKIVAVTATTGVAAINLNVPEKKIRARTLHSWAGIGLARESREKLLAKCRSTPACRKRWQHTDVLIIDEVSMFGADLLEKIDYIARAIRGKDESMGGLQVILSGDFLQLPPVKEEWVFTSKAWDEMVLVPFLFTEPKRYDDLEWFATLQRIRKGTHTRGDIEMLREREKAYAALIDGVNMHTLDIKPTMLYSRRVDVDVMNEKEMNKLPGETREYVAVDTFTPLTRGTLPDKYIPALDDAAPKAVKFKVGAQVMLKANLDVGGGLVNGSRGVILSLEEDLVTVKFVNGCVLKVARNSWPIEDNDGVAVRSQIPLILAWSLTIHKAQGSTLDFVVCDLGPSIFADGQAYVSLSRVRNRKGLFISCLYPKSIKVDKRALEYTLEMEALAA